MAQSETLIRELLLRADVRLNGERAWDVTVHEPHLYSRLLRDGVLGLGESYVDGWWDCDDLGGLIWRVLMADLEHTVSPWKLVLPVLAAKAFNTQRRTRARKDVSSHYDLGNVLFTHMLDARMTYSCAYWKEAGTLDAAQEAKLDLICRKIGLREGMRVLDIGCGWGSFMQFAAEKHGASAVGVTLSEQQVALGSERCRGLPVEFRLQDYRDIHGAFDRIVSVGMFEHVGPANYRTFFRKTAELLSDDGLLLLHTIGVNDRKNATDPWTSKYIFPGSHLPTLAQITAAAQTSFVVEDVHNIGVDYERTLHAWHENFERQWDGVLSRHYDERFHRMWRYFLLTVSGSFRARRNQVWQIVLSRKGMPEGYASVR